MNNQASVLGRSGQVRAGGRDASTSTRAERSGARRRVDIHTDEYEQPGECAERSGQARGGGRDASTSAEAEGDGANLLLGVHVHDFGVGGHKDRRV